MSVINTNETARTWQASKRELGVHLYLSGVEGDMAELVGTRVAGFPLHLSIVPVTDWIDPRGIVRRGRRGDPGRSGHAGVGEAVSEACAGDRNAARRRRLRSATGFGAGAGPVGRA